MILISSADSFKVLGEMPMLAIALLFRAFNAVSTSSIVIGEFNIGEYTSKLP